MTLRALAVAAFALALALHAPAAAQDSNPPPVKLGVVDMAALFDRCDARPRFERKVNALREELKQRFEVGKLELERQRAELGRLAPNDPTRETRARHLRRAIDEFETRTEAAKAELKRVADEQTVALLTRIEDAVRAYGARNGFAMIFKVTPDPKGDGGPAGTLQRRQVADLVYFAPTLDVTEGVLKLLNAHPAREPEPAPKPAPEPARPGPPGEDFQAGSKARPLGEPVTEGAPTRTR